MKQLTNEAFSPEESKKIYDNFLSIVGTRRDKLVKRYGAEAEKVAYAKAVKQVKKQAEKEPMEKDIEEGTCGYGIDGKPGNTPAGPMLIKLKEMVKDALTKKPVKEFETDEELIADEPISETSNNPYYNAIVTKAKEKGIPVGDYIKDLLKSKTDSEVAQMGYQDLAALAGIDGIDEDIDIGHQDDESGMMKAEVYRIGKYAMELYKMLDKYDNMDSEVDFPHWWQTKISKAKDLMVSAKHYLDFEMKEPQIDAMVDVASEEGVIDEKLKPSMGAGAYVDDFEDSKAPQFKGKSKKKKQEMAVAAYLSAKDKKKVAEAFLQRLHEDPETTKAVKRLEPILLDILNGITDVDKSQDDTEKDVEALDTSIDYLSAALTNKSPIDVDIDQKSFRKYSPKTTSLSERIFAKLKEGKSEYAKVEKQMFDLKKDGKRNTPEYEKLIKRRAELEKSKK